MTVLAPSDLTEQEAMLDYAINKHAGPIAIRYPRGVMPTLSPAPFVFGKALVRRHGTHITLAALGRMVHTALSAAEMLAEKGIEAEVLDLRAAKPLDYDTIFASAQRTGHLITIEDNTNFGGIGEAILAEGARRQCSFRVDTKAFPDAFIQQGTVSELMTLYKMDAAHIAADAERILQK